MITMFNTGRPYTANGQRIYWTQHSETVVIFYDVDRMIYEAVNVSDRGSDVATEAAILREYDHCRYNRDVPYEAISGFAREVNTLMQEN